MALYGGDVGSGLGRSVRRAPVLGGQAQNPLAMLQALFQRSVGGGGLGGGMGIPEHYPGIAPGGGPQMGIPEMPGMPGGGIGGLIPLPNPQIPTPVPRQQSAGDLRRGLLEILHPNISGIIGRKAQPGRPISNSVPQNNLRIAIPANGPFHHNAAVAHATKAQTLQEIRHGHVEAAQQRAGQMANLMRKSRGMGATPRRAIPAGY